MKKYFLLAVLFLGSLFVVPSFAQKLDSEHISEFDSDITINQDATIDVVEQIHYHFNTQKHGIYREIPIDYSVGGFKRSTDLKLNELYYYPEGNPNQRKSLYDRSMNNGWVVLKIGDPDRTITGDYIYVIDYTLVGTGISYFDTHDEVYLNIVGTSWEVPILKVNANINTFTEATDKICYTGDEGSTQQQCKYTETNNGFKLTTTTKLDALEGLTMSLKFPVDSIKDRTTQMWLGFIVSNLGILLPIPVIIWLISLLNKKWKNKKLTVIPHYEVPNDLDPLIGGYIYDTKQDYKQVSATIIWMATKGYLRIEKEGRKTYIVKTVDSIEDKSHIEDLFNALFSTKEKINIKRMPSTFTNKVQSIFSSVRSNSSEYINKGRVTAKGLVMTLGMLAAGGGFFFLTPLLVQYAAIGTGIGIGISGIAAVIIASQIDIRSKEGNETYHELKGLRMYIDTAEKHRIEFHNDPKKFRGVFEKLLPFAMLFGLEKKWAREFKDLYKETQPDWYRGDFTAFDAYMLTRTMSTLNSGVKSATNKAYGSNSGFRSGGWSSGGSGFSGGSSGGGGGGGGGGSW